MAFLQHMLKAVPYQVHMVLTDNGIRFAEPPRNRNIVQSRPMRFDRICAANKIAHLPTKPNPPWSHEDRTSVRGTGGPRGGQVEQRNRTITDATIMRGPDDRPDLLRMHLADVLIACNAARRRKTLNGLTPYEYICNIRTSDPDRAVLNPIEHRLGLSS